MIEKEATRIGETEEGREGRREGERERENVSRNTLSPLNIIIKRHKWNESKNVTILIEFELTESKGSKKRHVTCRNRSIE